ncbi:DedA family protein [Sporosarcina sp. BI001-red]|uniref:DedA family protein n=1 Tax=Sporosarcina sp. BI001-red TaxID=2282866 RepID=UPI000E24BBE1|nr:DedA family protein [Sporosarcina sp. BI001-red]REB07479.1 DedA family protein [Sporosarcina sp. BI001-red]
MSFIQNIVSFILHIDEHLIEIIQNFGTWSYVILFLIVFTETGIVIFPFLPGDSLLFAAGALASASEVFNIGLLLFVFFTAAVIGDTVNYHIGKTLGTAVTQKRWMGRLINQEKVDKAEKFFNKHGGKTIVIARFMPFIRTFIPFIAGSSRMNYRYFLTYNILGAALWVGLFTIVGYLFGNIPFVKENFSTIIMAVIVLSILPPIISYVVSHLRKK